MISRAGVEFESDVDSGELSSCTYALSEVHAVSCTLE